MMEKRVRMLGILGVISLLSYTAMVVFSPLAYPGYDWMSMAVSDLSAEGAPSTHPQNIMHLIVTVLVVVLFLVSLILVAIGAGKEQMKSLRVWAIVCLAAMLIGPMGTAFLPKEVFGLFERFSTFSAVVFNAVLGVWLFKGRFEKIN